MLPYNTKMAIEIERSAHRNKQCCFTTADVIMLYAREFLYVLYGVNTFYVMLCYVSSAHTHKTQNTNTMNEESVFKRLDN